jgi:hypothetical protein
MKYSIARRPSESTAIVHALRSLCRVYRFDCSEENEIHIDSENEIHIE